MALDHNLYNNWDEVRAHLGEGGGSDVTKEYVDNQDNALSERITINSNSINGLNTNKADKTELTSTASDLQDRIDL